MAHTATALKDLQGTDTLAQPCGVMECTVMHTTKKCDNVEIIEPHPGYWRIVCAMYTHLQPGHA